MRLDLGLMVGLGSGRITVEWLLQGSQVVL
jgi:hypothetical protein